MKGPRSIMGRPVGDMEGEILMGNDVYGWVGWGYDGQGGTWIGIWMNIGGMGGRRDTVGWGGQ